MFITLTAYILYTLHVKNIHWVIEFEVSPDRVTNYILTF